MSFRIGEVGFAVRIILAAVAFGVSREAFAWGYDHVRITRRAMELLPEADRATFGTEITNMPANSTLPDRAYTRLPDGRERFVWGRWGGAVPDTQGHPFVNSHLMFTNGENLDTLLWYVTNAVQAAKAGDLDALGGYAGCLAHALEDWTTPAHATVDDNMMNCLRTLLPPPDGSEFHDSKMHGRMEGGGFDLRDVTYEPRILADTPEKLAFRLLIEAQAGHLVARAQLVPILQAVYAKDAKAGLAAQKIGAVEGLRLVADAFHTISALARGDVLSAAGAVPLFACWPDEAPGLYYPQSLYAGMPTWKPILERLYREGAHRPEPDAWFLSPTSRRYVSWTLPPKTFRRFTCRLARNPDHRSERPIELHVRQNGVDRIAATLPDGRDEIPVAVQLSAATTNLAFKVVCGPSKNPKAPWIIWPVIQSPRLD